MSKKIFQIIFQNGGKKDSIIMVDENFDTVLETAKSAYGEKFIGIYYRSPEKNLYEVGKNENVKN